MCAQVYFKPVVHVTAHLSGVHVRIYCTTIPDGHIVFTRHDYTRIVLNRLHTYITAYLSDIHVQIYCTNIHERVYFNIVQVFELYK